MKKITSKVSITVALFTVLHFLVDGICALVIFQSLYNDDYNRCLIVFICYNFLAFLTQPLVGLLIDKNNYPRLFLVISVILLFIGVMFRAYFLPSAIFLGLGNSFFHISGGKFVTEKTNNNIVPLGFFVSTGAIGLMLGQKYYSNTLLLIFGVLIIIFTTLVLITKEKENTLAPFEEVKTNINLKYFITLFALCLVVMIRSFVGKICIYDFKTSSVIFVLISVAIALGKALGGVLAKYLGVTKSIIISMVISLVTLVFFNDNIYLTLLGLVAFNTTMPITLWYMNKLLNKKLGFAFGILAACLIPGYLLGMLFNDILIRQILIASLSVLSIVLIFVIKKMETSLHGNDD